MPNESKLPIVLAHGIARFDVLVEILKKKLKLPDTELGERFITSKGSSPTSKRMASPCFTRTKTSQAQ